MAVQIPQRVLDRIWQRIDVREADDCWPWKLSIGSHGYGQIGWGRSGEERGMVTAHRAAWTAANGPIPEDLTVDHLCRNRVCCNPAHLRLLTNLENARDNGMASRTHCPRGHEYSPENTRHDRSGGRSCKTCERAMANARYAARRAARLAEAPDRLCVLCGSLLSRRARSDAMYCSQRCAARASYLRHREVS